MGIKIISDIKNPLFSRRELVFDLEWDVAPTYIQVKEVIVKEFSVKEELIRINSVKGRFGVLKFKVICDVYDNLEDFNNIVRKTKQELESERKVKEEEKKAEEEKKKVEIEAKLAEEEKKKAEDEAKKVDKSEFPVEEKAEDKEDKEKEVKEEKKE